MLNLENRLYVFHDANGSFTDHSNSAQDYARDEFEIVLDKDTGYLYFGFYKPVNAIYIEMNAVNSIANSFTFEYKAAAWAAITPFSDETKGLTRSGFLAWDRNLDDEEKVTINSQEAYWYRLRPSATHSAGTKIQGLSIVFSDDQDLQGEVSNISSYLVSGQVSHINAHVAARDQLIQDLRNTGKLKVDISTGRYKNLNIFDILDIGQLREASKWKALAVIFDDVSDGVDDKYNQRYKKYNGRYKACLNNIQFLAIDTDDDGKKDINEEQSSATMTIFRR